MAKTLITEKTAAENIGPIPIAGQNLPATLLAWGLAGSEEIPVKFSPDGINFYALQIDGAAVKLTSANNAVTIYGPMQVRVEKPITAGAVGVALATGAHP